MRSQIVNWKNRVGNSRPQGFGGGGFAAFLWKTARSMSGQNSEMIPPVLPYSSEIPTRLIVKPNPRSFDG